MKETSASQTLGGKSESVPDLSISIVNWNTRDLLDDCLKSAKKSCAEIDHEIIVVDNSSSDGSADMVADKYPDVDLVRSRINLGFATANNVAFKHSRGRYFLLLNSDTIVLDDALPAMVSFMDDHPDAGAAGCKLLNQDGSLQRSCSPFPSLMTELFDALYLSKLFPKSRVFGSYAMSYWGFNETREVDFAGGSCLILRRDAVKEVGLMDESFFMYTEEADWCCRLKQKGWKVYFYPGAQIVHLGGESSKQYGSDIGLMLYSSRNQFLRKHRGRAYAAAHRGIVGLGALVRLPAGIAKEISGSGSREFVRFQSKVLRWSVLG
jgi:hypothetical protein